jgi:hypothetical protein
VRVAGRRSIVLFVLLLAFLSALSRLARADEALDASVSEIKRRGDEALVAGRPADALAAYEAAYDKKPDPALLYNKGRAHQALGDFASAMQSLEQFQKAAPPELRARVSGLEGLLKELRAKISQVTIACDVAGAAVRVATRGLGLTPLPHATYVPAGKQTLEVTKDGYFPYKREIDLLPGGVASFDVHLSSKETDGVLLVTSSVTGAIVTVDGKMSGTVPTEIVVAGGAHRLELAREGYKPSRSSFVIAAGERKTLDVGLQAESSSVLKKWWFWTGVGVVVVGATIATVIALTTEKEAGSGSLDPGRISAGLSF